jgi:hypothetical protein
MDNLTILIVVFIILLIIIVAISYKVSSIESDVFTGGNTGNTGNTGNGTRSDHAKKKLIMAKIMSKLWGQHLIYTRLSVMALLSDNPELPTLKTRLMRNPDDFARVLGPIYGADVGLRVQTLLTEHLELATKAVLAIKNNNEEEKRSVTGALYKNAYQLGITFDNITQNQSQMFVNHMKIHIDTLLANVGAYISKDYSKDVLTLDAYLNAGLEMAFDMV